MTQSKVAADALCHWTFLFTFMTQEQRTLPAVWDKTYILYEALLYNFLTIIM